MTKIIKTELRYTMGSWWLYDELRHWARIIDIWKVLLILKYVHFYCTEWLYYNDISH
jgi:hypothetical protein